MTEQFSWVPSPSCSPPGHPFPITSLALSAHVSPQTIQFRVLDKRPVSGPGRGPPSCNTSQYLRAQECPVPTTAGHCKQREEFWIRKGKLPLLKINLSQCDFFYLHFYWLNFCPFNKSMFIFLVSFCISQSSTVIVIFCYHILQLLHLIWFFLFIFLHFTFSIFFIFLNVAGPFSSFSRVWFMFGCQHLFWFFDFY